jgi:FtsH-binding integral membrane protein
MTDHDPIFEPHRPFVRELNAAIQTDYGAGGAAAIAAAMLPLAVAWALGTLWSSPVPWALMLLNFLVGMLWVRGWIKRRAIARLTSLEAYCAVNELSRPALQRYFELGGVYPFLATLPSDPMT